MLSDVTIAHARLQGALSDARCEDDSTARPRQRRVVAKQYFDRGLALEAMGRHDDAASAFRRALFHYQTLVTGDPTNDGFAVDVRNTLAWLQRVAVAKAAQPS